jgi:HEAT repeat protein
MGVDAVVATLAVSSIYTADTDTFSFPKPLPQVLAAVGHDIVPGVKKAISSDKENVRIAAFQVLSEMRPGAVDMLEELGKGVGDSNRFVRSFACKALSNLGADAAPAAQTLAGVIQHEDQFTRLRAAEALAHIGPPAKSVVPVLKSAGDKEKVRDVRDAIQIALFEIDLDHIAAEAAGFTLVEYRDLMKNAVKPDERTALTAVQAIAAKGPAAKDAIPALAIALRNPSPKVREAAIKAMAAMGPHARVASLTLARAAEDGDEDVRKAAQQTLQDIGAW